jgi:RNA polymerase-binding transcription factor DksA
MATKKKAAKPAKKTIAPKKAAPAKKPAAKPAGKVSKSAPKPAAKAAKPSAKPAKPNGSKAVPDKKPAANKHAVVVKPAAKVVKPEPKPLVKKTVPEPVKVEKKPEVPKEEVRKPDPVPPPPPPKKPVAPAKPVKVVIPEIKTKTVRKYEPEFTKSVLDQPENTQTGPTMRYSDAELVEFKELILKKLEQAKKELSYLQGLITRKDEMGGDETENRYMTMEDGSMSMEREQLAQMASRQINYIDHLEKAMMRIENKTYGICRVTGKLIDKARLKAVPHATLSIEAKQMMNK